LPVIVELGDLKDQASSLTPFLERRLGSSVKIDGGELVIEDVENRPTAKSSLIKTYLKRYLHNSGLREKYRIFVEKDRVKVVKVEIEEEVKESSTSLK